MTFTTNHPRVELAPPWRDFVPKIDSDHCRSTSVAGKVKHVIALDYCTTDTSEARRHARCRLAEILGRQPHEIEVDAAIYRCDGGKGCCLDPYLYRSEVA